MLTMAPPPASRMAGTACFMPRNTPLAFTLRSASQADVLSVSGSNVPLIPALFTRRSSLPERRHGRRDRRLASPPRW